MNLKHPLRVKCAGGVAAQLLALQNALYVSQRTGRDFVFEYYPFGTGTFWPFEIHGLLRKQELGNLSLRSRGHLEDTDGYTPGTIVQNHPINKSGISLDKIYSKVRSFGLDRFLLSVRGELPINRSLIRLNKVTRYTRSISGGFLPISDQETILELHRRFLSSGLKSPFKIEEKVKSTFDVVIHYRLGDKRAKFTNPGVVGDDGVMDPLVIFEILSGLGKLNSRILLISDEPDLAQQLLLHAGVKASIPRTKSDIWDDIYSMAGAEIFIGTWSQVSQFASSCVLHNGGKAYLPSEKSGKNFLNWKINGINFYTPRFLDSSHSIYYE